MRAILTAVFSAAMLALIAVQVHGFLAVTGGRLIYPLDDTYIEMSIARTLAAGGGWGVAPGAFAGVGSSLLWPWLLAGAQLFTASEWTPMALATAGAIAAVAAAHLTLKRYRLHPVAHAVSVLAIAIALPLVSLATTGMEHALQVAVAIALAGYASAAIDAERPRTIRNALVLGFLSAAAVAIRYDTFSVVVAVAIVAAVAKRWEIVVAALAGAAIPAGVYAVVAATHHWPLVPVTLLIKSRLAGGISFNSIVVGPIGILRHAAYLWIPLLIAAGLLFSQRSQLARSRFVLLMIYVITAVLQLEGGISGSAFNWRYDVYLTALGVVAIAASGFVEWNSTRLKSKVFAVAFVILIATLGLQSSRVAARVRDDARVEWLTTSQVGLFLEGTPWIQSPAVQDLGEPTYRGRRAVMDLDFLGTREIFEAMRGGTWTRGAFTSVAHAHGTTVAIVLTHTVNLTPIPDSWTRVGRWTIDDTTINGYTFFAADRATADHLRDSLERFASALPPAVHWQPD